MRFQLTKLNALDMSIEAVKTGFPLELKCSMTEVATQEHIVVLDFDWYANCKLSEPILSPSRRRITKSINFRMREPPAIAG